MGEYLYIWMVRERPRRKGGEPGPWRPYPSDAVATEDRRDTQPYFVDIHNAENPKVENAVFRVAVGAMERVA